MFDARRVGNARTALRIEVHGVGTDIPLRIEREVSAYRDRRIGVRLRAIGIGIPTAERMAVGVRKRFNVDGFTRFLDFVADNLAFGNERNVVRFFDRRVHFFELSLEHEV